MSESFDHVYRISTLISPCDEATVDELATKLPIPLPKGYREYMTTLGEGELCHYLRVNTPMTVAQDSEADAWERVNLVERFGSDRIQSSLKTEDIQAALVFGTSAEGDTYFSCPRFPAELFEFPRHDRLIRMYNNGFWGAVQHATSCMRHDFPFFKSYSRQMNYHLCDIQPDIGYEGLIALVKRQWPKGSHRISRGSDIKEYPHLFVRDAQAHFEIHPRRPDLGPVDIPEGSFSVVAHFDRTHQAEVLNFLDSIRLVK